MLKASDTLNKVQREQVDQAVREAELKTCAEIVPVVATQSGRYDRPEDLAGVWVAVLGVIVAWAAFSAADAWGHWLSGLAVVLIILFGFSLGAMLASRWAALRRVFTGQVEMAEEVELAARGIFAREQVHHTREATGLVVYVSLYERMARVHGDATVVEKLGQQAMDELAGELIAKLSEGDVAAALCDTIRTAGERLGPVLPRQDDDVDELPNALVLLD